MAGVKRGRPAWEDIEDVDQLHELLSKMDAQCTKLKKEVKELKAVIKAQGKEEEQEEIDGEDPEKTEAAAKAASTQWKAIKKNITSQMVYKRSSRGNGRADCVIPNMSIADVKALLPTDVLGCAKDTPKQYQVLVDHHALYKIFGGNCFSKSLRYGSSLSLNKGLKLVYDKQARTLKVTGGYSMG